MFRFAATSTLALCIGAGAALADMTPAEVWENLQKNYADYGYEVTGQVEDGGGNLTVSDATFTMKNEGGATTITVPRLTFQETGDARVRMVIDGDVALNSTFLVPAAPEDKPQDEAPADAPTDGAEAEAAPEAEAGAEPELVEMTMTGTLKLPGNETVVSGTPEDMLYEFTYPSVAFDLSMPADPETGVTIPVTGALTDVTGTQRQTTSEGNDTTFDVKASEGTVQIAAEAPAEADGTGGGKLDFQARMTDLTSSGTAQMPAESFDLGTQMTQALAAGLDIQGSFGFGAANLDFDFVGKDDTGDDQSGKGTVTLGTGDAAIQVSGDGLAYKGGVANSNVELTTASLPFPISYATDRTSFDLLIPVTKGNAAQPFKFAYALEGLTFADAIWNLFDPNSQLPRDPASLTVDLSGEAIVTEDLFDPSTAQAEGSTAPDAPFIPQTLAVNKVSLDAAGAKADITGSLDFGANPNEPVGKLNGTFEGVNGLMDNLVAMGLVPQEQMMGMRMMLAMFAKPAEGNADQLTSEIEFREGGSIFANGQQVK